MALPNRTSRSFTEAARAAGLAKRRELAKQRPKGIDHREAFVVRLTGPGQPFGWEIRKFGSIVLSRSKTGFGTQLLAQAAGQQALEQ